MSLPQSVCTVRSAGQLLAACVICTERAPLWAFQAELRTSSQAAHSTWTEVWLLISTSFSPITQSLPHHLLPSPSSSAPPQMRAGPLLSDSPVLSGRGKTDRRHCSPSPLLNCTGACVLSLMAPPWQQRACVWLGDAAPHSTPAA